MDIILSWQQIHELAGKLAGEIKNGGFAPDYLVGIAAGGLIPLALIAEKLELRNILTVSASSYDGKSRGELKIFNLPKIDLAHKKILLVDDIAETGETMRRVAEVFLNQYGVGVLKTATLALNKAKCKFRPDFCALEERGWIVFPWEN